MAVATVVGMLDSGAARAGAPTATAVRVKSLPHAVRLVVRMENVTVSETEVFMVGRPRALERGRPGVRVEVSGFDALVRAASGAGVAVGLVPKANALVIAAATSPGRFKYLSYRVRRVPQRLAMDLWRSAPPRPGARARFGGPGCLTIGVDSADPGRLTLSGTVGPLFEATFLVRIRRADGRVIKRRIVTMQPGIWRESIGYRMDRAQWGTVEAIAESAKDGSIDCLAQQRVRLRPR